MKKILFVALMSALFLLGCDDPKSNGAAKTENVSKLDSGTNKAYAEAEAHIPLCTWKIQNRADYIAKYPFFVDANRPFFEEFSINNSGQIVMEGSSIVFSDNAGNKENIRYQCRFISHDEKATWYTVIYGEGGNDRFFDTESSRLVGDTYGNVRIADDLKNRIKITTGGGYEQSIRQVIRGWNKLFESCNAGSKGACAFVVELTVFLNDHDFCHTENNWSQCEENIEQHVPEAFNETAEVKHPCFHAETFELLKQSEARFLSDYLKGRGNFTATMALDVEETDDSMGGPEFTCAGTVSISCSQSNDHILTYNIKYDVYTHDEIVISEEILRTNFQNSSD